MRLITALVLVLLFGSCQQRYWQVKKVKSDQQKSTKIQENSSIVAKLLLPDTAIVLENQFEDALIGVAKAREIETKQDNFPAESEPQEIETDPGSLREIVPDGEYQRQDAIPKHDRRAVIMTILLYLSLAMMTSGVMIGAGIVFFWLLDYTLLIPLAIAFGIFILYYYLGRKRANKRIKNTLDFGKYRKWFFLAMLLYLPAVVLLTFFMQLGIWLVFGIFLYTLVWLLLDNSKRRRNN